jgi:hypothetical protein
MLQEQSFWNSNSPMQERYEELFEKLVPTFGESITSHGELLRCVGRIYYDRYNNGFGNGPFDDEFKIIVSSEAQILQHLSHDDLREFKRAFKNMNLGERQIDDEWVGDESMEKLMAAVVKVADQCEKTMVSSPFKGVDDLLAGIRSEQADLRKEARAYALDLLEQNHPWITTDMVTQFALAALSNE